MNIYDFAKRVESLYEKAESVSDYDFENPNNGNVFRSYLSVMETLHEFVQDRTNLEILEKHFQKYERKLEVYPLDYLCKLLYEEIVGIYDRINENSLDKLEFTLKPDMVGNKGISPIYNHMVNIVNKVQNVEF